VVSTGNALEVDKYPNIVSPNLKIAQNSAWAYFLTPLGMQPVNVRWTAAVSHQLSVGRYGD